MLSNDIANQLLGFPGSSNSKESACNTGDLGLIPSQEDPLEKDRATHSSIPACRIPWYPTLARLFGGIRPMHFIRQVYPLQLFAFTTSSSAATLPFTYATAQEKLGVSREVSSFVLPIGTTINMDGTSCYQTVATIFIAQALGIDLSISQLLTITAMTTLSSIGTPAIPGGSYVILAMVLTSVGIPAESLALIIGIDRPLDMLRTSVNVTGDVAVSVIMDKQSKK